MISVTIAESQNDVLGILALQRANLRRNVPVDEQISEGFVTVEHRFDVLWRMNQVAPSIIAKNAASELIGYVLTTLPEFAPEVPEFGTLLLLITGLTYKEKPLLDYNFYVVGQACVTKSYRGQKILAQMMQMHRQIYSDRYQLFVATISSMNKRSLRAHMGVGFEIIHSFHEPALNETWHILVWDWQK